MLDTTDVYDVNSRAPRGRPALRLDRQEGLRPLELAPAAVLLLAAVLIYRAKAREVWAEMRVSLAGYQAHLAKPFDTAELVLIAVRKGLVDLQ